MNLKRKQLIQFPDTIGNNSLAFPEQLTNKALAIRQANGHCARWKMFVIFHASLISRENHIKQIYWFSIFQNHLHYQHDKPTVVATK